MFAKLEDFASDYEDLKEFLIQNKEVSYQVGVEGQLRKIFLLSCASYHEKVIQDVLKVFISEHSDDERVLCFVSNKAINRQYHTLFSWKENNVNSFLGLFGSNFKRSIEIKINASPRIKSCMKDFLTLGVERSKMVHEDYFSYRLEKTFDEIRVLNENAMVFINFLKESFQSSVSHD